MDSLTVSISGFQLWIAAKLFIAVGLIVWETRHNTYKPHQLVQRYFYHAILTEWIVFKFVLGLIGWVLGKGFPASLYPIRKPGKNASCQVCKDTGVIKNGWMDRGRPCACAVTKRWSSQLVTDRNWRN